MRWHKEYRLDTLDDDWDYWPSESGVYVILGQRGLRRAVGKGMSRVLYIGQAKNIRNRLWYAWYGEHSGTGLLWDFPKVARALTGHSTAGPFDRGGAIGRLTAKVAFPIRTADLSRFERALLFAYFYRHGELPPLNATMPKRWDRQRPTTDLIQWATRGIRTNA
jgi:hypothetical protein